MLQLEVYINKIDKKKISNSKKATNTLDDGDWEEIETK